MALDRERLRNPFKAVSPLRFATALQEGGIIE